MATNPSTYSPSPSSESRQRQRQKQKRRLFQKTDWTRCRPAFLGTGAANSASGSAYPAFGATTVIVSVFFDEPLLTLQRPELYFHNPLRTCTELDNDNSTNRSLHISTIAQKAAAECMKWCGSSKKLNLKQKYSESDVWNRAVDDRRPQAVRVGDHRGHGRGSHRLHRALRPHLLPVPACQALLGRHPGQHPRPLGRASGCPAAKRPRRRQHGGSPFGGGPRRGLQGGPGVRGLPLRTVAGRGREAAAYVRPRLPHRVHRRVVLLPLHLSSLPEPRGAREAARGWFRR